MASERPTASVALDRLGITHGHTPAATLGIVVLAAGLGGYAAWLTADFGVSTLVFVVAAVGSAYVLYRRSDGWDALAVACYLFAAFLALTPVFLNLPYVVDGGRYGIGSLAPFVFSLANLVVLVVFLLLAAVPAAAGYLVRRWRRGRRADDGTDPSPA